MSDLPPLLRANAADYAAALLRTLTSAADVVHPGMGSFFGEMIAHVIPGQREERLVDYVARVGRLLRDARFVQAAHAERLDALEERLRSAAHEMGPERAALFEDGARAAARATSTERAERIARIVSGGLDATESEAAYTRELLALTETLSDLDVAFLLRFDNLPGREARPLQRSEPLAELPLSRGEWLALGVEEREKIERQRTFLASRRERLAAAGVLNRVQPPPKTVQQGGRLRQVASEPTFTISALGRLVLKRMGLAQEVQPLGAEGS